MWRYYTKGHGDNCDCYSFQGGAFCHCTGMGYGYHPWYSYPWYFHPWYDGYGYPWHHPHHWHRYG